MNTDNSNSKKSWIFRVLKKNPFASLWLILLLAGGIYSFIFNNAQVKAFETEKQALIQSHQLLVDSLEANLYNGTARAFSWAVRGELMRNNLEQVDVLFSWLLNDSNIQLINLIDPVTKNILISSDKKIENTVIADSLFFNANQLSVDTQDGKRWISTPIFGLDKKIGVLSMQLPNTKLKTHVKAIPRK